MFSPGTHRTIRLLILYSSTAILAQPCDWFWLVRDHVTRIHVADRLALSNRVTACLISLNLNAPAINAYVCATYICTGTCACACGNSQPQHNKIKAKKKKPNSFPHHDCIMRLKAYRLHNVARLEIIHGRWHWGIYTLSCEISSLGWEFKKSIFIF